MLLKEAVDNLAYRLGKSDDEPFKERLTRDVSVARGEILRREINKKSKVSASHSNSLTGLEVIESNLPYENPTPSKKKVWRTKEKIPRPLMYHDQNPGFIFVGGVDYVTAHQYVVPERMSRRTTHFKDEQYYTYFDDYIFFFDNIKFCSIRAIFGDIIAAANVKNASGTVCIPEIIISDELFTGMKRLLLEEENEMSLRYKPEVEVNVDQS